MLVLVTGHVRLIRLHLPAKRTRQKRGVFVVTADPCGAKSVNRVFMTDPLVLGLESTWAECAAEREVAVRPSKPLASRERLADANCAALS